MSGACESAPMMAAPAMADAGCENCGSGVQNLGYEGYNSSSYNGEIVGSSYGGVVHSGANYGEVVPSVRN